MKRFFSITAVVMLLVVLVMGSCEKEEMQVENLTGQEKFNEVTKNGLLIEVKEKSNTVYDSIGVEGVLYNYYPNPDNLDIKQELFVTDEKGKDIIMGIFPDIKTGTYYENGGSITCSGFGRDCIAIIYSDGIVIYH